jgi:D-serine deaminase-like pyridoxal phosphate-dependent protein
LIAGAAAIGAAWLRPGDRGGPHAPYFAELQKALQSAGIGSPAIVIDAARWRANLERIRRNTHAKLPLRVVVKSLPSLDLVDAALAVWGTQRAMVFNAPQLVTITQARPQVDLLLGKPLTAAAAHEVLQGAAGASAARQTQWLIDTPQRLAQYRELARGLGTPLRVNFEIDVGLHRGGIEDPAELEQMLRAVQAEPLLQWQGFMGYEAHVAAIPDVAGSRDEAWREVHARYGAAWAAAQRVLGADVARRERVTLNSGGSHTYRRHDDQHVPNEVSVGSAAVKPGDFDQPDLADLLPAAFIAAPVLKTMSAFRLPVGVEWISSATRWWDVNQRRALCIHGGHWLADVASPPGVAESGLYGHSSNQQVLVAPPSVSLRPDDFVFWHPRQSEAVLLQFGDLLVYDQGRITTRWPAFTASA